MKKPRCSRWPSPVRGSCSTSRRGIAKTTGAWRFPRCSGTKRADCWGGRRCGLAAIWVRSSILPPPRSPPGATCGRVRTRVCRRPILFWPSDSRPPGVRRPAARCATDSSPTPWQFARCSQRRNSRRTPCVPSRGSLGTSWASRQSSPRRGLPSGVGSPTRPWRAPTARSATRVDSPWSSRVSARRSSSPRPGWNEPSSRSVVSPRCPMVRWVSGRSDSGSIGSLRGTRAPGRVSPRPSSNTISAGVAACNSMGWCSKGASIASTPGPADRRPWSSTTSSAAGSTARRSPNRARCRCRSTCWHCRRSVPARGSRAGSTRRSGGRSGGAWCARATRLPWGDGRGAPRSVPTTASTPSLQRRSMLPGAPPLASAVVSSPPNRPRSAPGTAT